MAKKRKGTKKIKKGFKRIRLIHPMNAPDRNYLPYFTEYLDDYRAFKSGELVDFPDDIVEKIKQVARVTEDDKASVESEPVSEELDSKDEEENLDKPEEEIESIV